MRRRVGVGGANTPQGYKVGLLLETIGGTMVGYESDKATLLKRLARAEGQVRGIARMVEEDRYCIDVLQQVSAATSALQKVAVGLMSDHLEHCVVGAVRDDADGGRAKIDEAVAAIERLVRS